MSSATASPPNDFPDWLSPILVKELRQGLKTWIFIGIFIAIQVVMIILLGFQLLAVSNRPYGNASDGFSALFWGVIFVPLIFLMPARGLVTISGEVKANTLELVQLTRLGAFRTILGKWIALSAQSVLLVAAVLPYAVLRYFFGAVDIVDDLAQLAIFLCSSVTLTAGAIALSSAPLVVRIIVLIGMIPGWMSVVGFFTFTYSKAHFLGVASGSPGVDFVWVLLAAEAVYTLIFLEIAASRIAPAAENHSTLKRFGALFCAVLTLVCSLWAESLPFLHWDSDTWHVIIFVLAPAWAWFVLEALTEPTSTIPKIYEPFVRRGFVGRILARVFCPGWASGVIFTAILLIVCFFSMRYGTAKVAMSSEVAHSALMGFVAFYFSVVSPVLVLQLFPRLRQRAWVYLLVQVLMILLFVVMQILNEDSSNPESLTAWLAPFPTSFFFSVAFGKGNSELMLQYGGVPFLICAGIITVLLIMQMRKEFAQMAAVERGLQDPSLSDMNAAPALTP